MSVDASQGNAAPACRRAEPRGSSKRRNGLLLVAGVVIVAIALGVAVDRQWLSLGALTPLLLTLPCALMMLMCMRGMNRSASADANGRSDDDSVSR